MMFYQADEPVVRPLTPEEKELVAKRRAEYFSKREARVRAEKQEKYAERDARDQANLERVAAKFQPVRSKRSDVKSKNNNNGWK